MEGVHLRGGPIARGGLRWSDRAEDYRTESPRAGEGADREERGHRSDRRQRRVHRTPAAARPAAFRAQGLACYQDFIRGLLDLTDNVVDGEVVHPPGVRCTTTTTRTWWSPPTRAPQRFPTPPTRSPPSTDFWLGDAFASGGSNGYDHKQMGITARGAWVSVQRHFAERGIDVQADPVTVLGIGDMSGDVFGNGMLLSRSIRLVAAFNHQHIFLDPDPDPQRAYEERQRLFELPGSSWADYDQARISAGGGVHTRTQSPSPHARGSRPFDIDADAAVTRRADSGAAALPGRPDLERRHRHLRQGGGGNPRRGRRPRQRYACASTPRSCAARSSAKAATSASPSAAGWPSLSPVAPSTPTSSTTPAASTAPTTR
jgi:glutamate dehydrogenase